MIQKWTRAGKSRRFNDRLVLCSGAVAKEDDMVVAGRGLMRSIITNFMP